MSTRVPRAASICTMCPFYLHLFVVSFFREAVPKFSIGPIDNRQQFKVSFLFICCGRKTGMRRMGGKSFLGLRANFSLKVNMWHRNLIKLLIVWLIVAAAANAFIATAAKATGKSWCRSYLGIILALTFGKVFAFHLAPQEIDFWCLAQLFLFLRIPRNGAITSDPPKPFDNTLYCFLSLLFGLFLASISPKDRYTG